MRKRTIMGVLAAAMLPVIALVTACQQVPTRDMQGLLQAVEGQEAIITLPDGTAVRVRVEDVQIGNRAGDLVGDRVSIEVRGAGDRLELVNVRHLGEDDEFSGVIESIAADIWVIGGRSFKVDAATVLDGGLRQGVSARVEFVNRDGAMIAKHIETDEADERFAGTVEFISADRVTIGGKTFELMPGARQDKAISPGTPVRVRFTEREDGALVAVRVARAVQDDVHVSATIESMGPDVWRIGGRDFIVNEATRLDSGLAVGVPARVEFVALGDGRLVATEIETGAAFERFTGAVESMSNAAWVVGGQTFKVNDTTRVKKNISQGDRVQVRFVTLADGSKLAARFQEDRSGRGGDGDDNGGSGRGRNGSDDNRGAADRTPSATSSLGEDQKLTGVIDSITAGAVVINGQTFKIDASTELDSGLAPGVTATVEFFVLPDGTRLAKEVETGARRSSSGSR